ncbi:hypothetical protein [Faecalimonas sp.]
MTFESMYYIQPLDDTEPWYTKEAQERWDKSVIDDLWWSFEENNFTIQDANRRNTQMLTDFIRSKKFAGDFRPVVTVSRCN